MSWQFILTGKEVYQMLDCQTREPLAGNHICNQQDVTYNNLY